MEERFAFWKGVTAGILGGIAIGALTRLTLDEEGPVSAGRSSQSNPGEAESLGQPFRQTLEFELRREAAESAGDPRITGPFRREERPEGRAFERQGGAPGGRTPAELLEMPGRPGKLIDHSKIH